MIIDKEYNYTRILGICLIIGILIFYSPIPKWIIKSQEPIVVNETKIITVKEIVTVLVTPIPDNKIFFAGEYQEGLRKLTQPFSWLRKNVTGLKDMKVTIRVYNYMIFDKLHWFNPSDYKYYIQYPDNRENKFIFIMVNIYMDDVIGQDARMWLPQQKNFALEINNKMYYPKEYPYQLRFKELEYTNNLNDDNKIMAYGYSRLYTGNSPETAGETADTHYYLRGGLSNSEDGYILYEIPKNINETDIIIRGSFYKFGSASWLLKQ